MRSGNQHIQNPTSKTEQSGLYRNENNRQLLTEEFVITKFEVYSPETRSATVVLLPEYGGC